MKGNALKRVNSFEYLDLTVSENRELDAKRNHKVNELEKSIEMSFAKKMFKVKGNNV